MAVAEREERSRRDQGRLRVIAAVAAVIAALALLWSADEAHYRGCVEHAVAAFPTVPVSAYVERSRSNVGPLKVSFAAQRTRAVNACHHL